MEEKDISVLDDEQEQQLDEIVDQEEFYENVNETENELNPEDDTELNSYLESSNESASGEVDYIRDYLNKIKMYEILDDSTVKDKVLFVQASEKGSVVAKRAEEEVTNSLARLCANQAIKYWKQKNKSVDLWELIREANISVLHAIKNYDHVKRTEKEAKFSTYAAPYITKAISNTYKKLALPIGIRNTEALRMDAASKSFSAKYNKEADAIELLSEHFLLWMESYCENNKGQWPPEEKIENILKSINKTQNNLSQTPSGTINLDETYENEDGESTERYEVIEDATVSAEKIDEAIYSRDMIKQIFSKLDYVERLIAACYINDPRCNTPTRIKNRIRMHWGTKEKTDRERAKDEEVLAKITEEIITQTIDKVKKLYLNK